MLGEASQSTAIAGFSSGRNSSIHSGWLEQNGDEHDEREPQQLEQPHRRPITAAPPGDEAEAGRDQHGEDRQRRPTTASRGT